MRITIATGPCLPAPPILGGGMIRTWMSLAAAFADDGHEVTLFARAYPGQLAEEDAGGFLIKRWGGFDQPRWIGTSLLFDSLYATLALRHLPQADILVTNDFWMPFISPLLRPEAGRVVVSVNRYPKHQLWLYRGAHLLVVPTRSMAHAVEKQQPSWIPRTACIPNCYDETAFFISDTVERNPRHVLYAGRIHPEKGLEMLLSAFKLVHRQIPGCQLTLAGPHSIAEGGGGGGFLRRLQRQAKDLPVVFSGSVHDSAQLAYLYQSHGVFCYPSLADQGESMGIAPLEAMACGCVPVVSSNPVFADWLCSGVNGWSFDHHSDQSIEALAGRLNDCLADETRQEEMRRSALKATSRFQSQVVADEFLEIFDYVCDEPL